MTIKTINGSSSNWLRDHQAGLSKNYESALLTDFSLEYVKYLSYERVEELLQHRMGNAKLSVQHLFDMVDVYAEQIKKQQISAINDCKSSNYACKIAAVDIYDAESEEIIYLSDGVCVTEQKAHRDKVPKVGKERTTTNILLLQTDPQQPQSYTTIVPAQGVDIVDLARAELQKAYGTRSECLPIVCISDGARSIKNENQAIFGYQVTHFLDWFHIQQKIAQFMSQIALNKADKKEYFALINSYLWAGKAISTVLVLKFMPVKNTLKRNELIGYLEKNAEYIIDYDRRKKANKIIGSGRTEKSNDCIVSKRQKRKGLSWSPKGSRNLDVLTAYHQYAPIAI